MITGHQALAVRLTEKRVFLDVHSNKSRTLIALPGGAFMKLVDVTLQSNRDALHAIAVSVHARDGSILDNVSCECTAEVSGDTVYPAIGQVESRYIRRTFQRVPVPTLSIPTSIHVSSWETIEGVSDPLTQVVGDVRSLLTFWRDLEASGRGQ